MKMTGRTIAKGFAEGTVLKLKEPLSFLGGVEAATGEVKVENGGNVAGKILVFPRGKGSTVGSFVMYDLMVHGKAPSAVINTSAETIVATGAVISSIPMVDSVDVELIEDGDRIIVDADTGVVEHPDVKETVCASSVVVIDGKFIMLHRPENSRSYPGKWSLVAGKMEEGESPLDTAIREIREETGIEVDEPLATMDVLSVREGNVIWRVHPFLFRAKDGTVPSINSENTEYRMCSPDDLDEMDLVPNTIKAVKDMMRSL